MKLGPTVHGPMGFLSVWFCDSWDIPEALIPCIILEALFLLIGGAYCSDLISGIVHLFLDYEKGTNDDLRLHVEHSIPDVIHFEQTNDLFKDAKKRDKYLWNFHSHHDAPYPSADSNLELIRQIVVPMSPWLTLLCILAALGFTPLWLSVMVCGGTAFGPVSQFTHFLAHARNRGLVQSKFLMKLQDWHIILNPEVHQSHHIYFDRDFCILNGWANPVVNRLRRFGSYVGFFPKEAPTVTTRRQRAERKGETQQKDLDDGCRPTTREITPVTSSEVV